MDIGGNIHLGTNGVGSESMESYRTSGSVVIIVSRNCCTRKLTVCGSGRNNQDRIGGRTLTAVRQRAVDLQILTGTLRAEGRGTATVTVRGNDTTHLDHVLSHLVGGEAGRVGSLLTVGNGDHQRTVGADAHEGSGGDTRAVIRSIQIHGVAVGVGLNQEAEQHGDRLLLPAGQGIVDATDPGLGHIGGTGLTGDGVVVVVDDHDGLNAAGGQGSVLSTAVGIVLTIQNGIAERLTNQLGVLLVICFVVPAQRAVGSNDYVAVSELLCFESLGRSGLGTVVTRLRPHSLCAGNDLNKFVVNVNNRCMEYLSASTGIVVQNLLVLFNTGSDIPFFFGNNIVIVTSAVAVVINTCSESVCGKRAGKH